MKTKELIRRLQEADPTGELHVNVCGADPYFVACEPAYYDGRLFIVDHDPDRVGKCWSPIGCRFVSSGYKVKIHVLDVEDLLMDDPDFPVEIEGRSKHYEEWIVRTREESRRIDEEIEREAASDAAASLNAAVQIRQEKWYHRGIVGAFHRFMLNLTRDENEQPHK